MKAMKVRIGLVLAAVVGALGVQAVATTPAYADGPQTPGIGWQWSEEGQGYYRAPQNSDGGPGGPSGPILTIVEYDSPTWYCVEAPDRVCDGYQSHTCGDGIGPTGRPWFARATLTRETEDDPFTLPNLPDCVEVSDDDWIPLEEISYRVDYEVFQPLGKPVLKLDPSPRGLVNLPVIVSTTYPEGVGADIISLDPVRIRVPIHIDRPRGGLDGEIIADASFTWTFESGKTASGRGKPYTRTVDPRDDGGYYVSETFGTVGTKTIDLNVTWTGTVIVPPIEPQVIEPVEIETSTQVTVVEARSVLGES